MQLLHCVFVFAYADCLFSGAAAQLICIFVFAYVKSRFSNNRAHIFQKTKVMDLEQRTSVVQTKIVELQRSPFARSKQDDSLEKL